MSYKYKKIDISSLVKLGLKEKLLSRFSDEQLKYLISYNMNYRNSPEISKNLNLLAYLEFNGKVGSALLASEGLATIAQLKILDKDKILLLISEYINHHNPSTVIKMIKEFIILEQQDKLYSKTNGLKGEYTTHIMHHGGAR